MRSVLCTHKESCTHRLGTGQ